MCQFNRIEEKTTGKTQKNSVVLDFRLKIIGRAYKTEEKCLGILFNGGGHMGSQE